MADITTPTTTTTTTTTKTKTKTKTTTTREHQRQRLEQEFQEALSIVRASSSNSVQRQSAGARLSVAKKALRSLLRRRVRQSPGIPGDYWSTQSCNNPSWQHYPSPYDIPTDPGNTAWTLSFDPLTEQLGAAQFYNEWGFVVFQNVLDNEACDATISEIWDHLEAHHDGLDRSNSTTYHLLPTKRYGLPDDQAIFSRQIVANRLSPRLHAALDTITPPWHVTPSTSAVTPPVDQLDEADTQHIVVSHDRWCLYPPSKIEGMKDVVSAHRQTKNPGAHLDLCPWEYLPQQDRRYSKETDIDLLTYGMVAAAAATTTTTAAAAAAAATATATAITTTTKTFNVSNNNTSLAAACSRLCDFRAEMNIVRGDRGGPHHQGVLNLLDNSEADGGTAIVPKFHNMYQQWSNSLGRWEDNRVGQRRRGNAFVFANPHDPIHQLARRVTMRKGSLLVWNQMTVHRADPNASVNCRIAQFVRGFRSGELSIERRRHRNAAIRRELRYAKVEVDEFLDPCDTARTALYANGK